MIVHSALPAGEVEAVQFTKQQLWVAQTKFCKLLKLMQIASKFKSSSFLPLHPGEKCICCIVLFPINCYC